MSRKGGIGGGTYNCRWVHPKSVNSIVVFCLSCRKALVGTRRAISVIIILSHLVEFLHFRFSHMPGWRFPRALIESFVGNCMWFESHICLEKTS